MGKSEFYLFVFSIICACVLVSTLILAIRCIIRNTVKEENNPMWIICSVIAVPALWFLVTLGK